MLSDSQITNFHRDGYLVVPSLICPDQMALLQGVYDELFASRAGREIGNQYDLAGTDEDDVQAQLPQIVNPSDYAPQLKNSKLHVIIQQLAQQLLGPDAKQQNEHAILKPAGVGPPTPWHQDEAYWAGDLEYNALTFWIPLQHATAENGCLHFIPVSHQGEVLEHFPIGHNPKVHGLETDQADASKAVVCPVPLGGASIHHCRTLHYAGSNRTEEQRRAYIIGYGIAPKPRQIPRDFPWKQMRQTARDQRRKQAGTKPTSDGRAMADR